MSRRFVLLGLLSCVAAVVSGCSDSNMGGVTGSVTYRGKPLPNAHVTFTPVSGGKIASGLTDTNGKYELGTMAKNDGALVGKHKIHIIAHGPDRPLRPGEMGSGLPGDMAPGEPIIPQKYFTPETSGLTHEVVRGGNTVNLEIKD